MSPLKTGGPENGPPGGDGIRTGVFVCCCGGNISDIVDVEQVAREVGRRPGVACALVHTFICSDPGQALIEQKIAELKLNRVVLAACSPTLHQLTFRRAVSRAGLNQFLFEHVNVREQVSWVTEDLHGATRKATRLVAAAVARTRNLVPLEKRRIPIRPAALVIGGGVAGLVAARDLARRGTKVTLVESRPFLGGRMAQLHTLFPTGEEAREVLRRLMQAVVRDPLVTTFTNATILESRGVVGSFRTRIRIAPRGVNKQLNFAGSAIAACPEETVSEFDYGLGRRKAIYFGYPGCWPPMPAIDWNACTRCGRCVSAGGGKGIDLDEKPYEIEVPSGVIVLATGFDPYEPLHGEYGYRIFPKVVTLQQLVRLLDPEGPTAGRLPVSGNGPLRVGFIHCVGARQWEGVHQQQADGKVNDYCARTCCTAALHAALRIRELYPDARIASFYQDIRTYGRGHEAYYERASEAGVLFIRYDAKKPPRVRLDPRGEAPLVVQARDLLTGGRPLEVPCDLVVLATGIVPHNVSELVDMYRCAVGSDRFLLEVHPKLRPVELAVAGVFLAGTCQGPMNVTEASAAASAAASKAAAMIAQGQVEMDPIIAKVDDDLCTGCRTCLTVCPYDAISRDPARKRTVVNEALCAGCGTCAAACPSDAIQQFGFTDAQVRSELAVLLEGAGPGPAVGSEAGNA